MHQIRTLRHVAGTVEELAHNSKHSLASSHALVHFSSQSVYSFIPKNACTTFRVSLAFANGCIQDSSQWEWVHKNNRTFSATLPQLAVAPYTFVILRCPFRRIVSVYLDKIVDGSDDLSGLLEHIDYQYDPLDITFSKFLNMVLTAGVMRSNIHWRPQTDFLVYSDYDDYFAVENMPTAIDTVEKRLGISIIDARRLSKHGTDRYEAVEAGLFAHANVRTIRNLKANGQCPSYRSFYSEAIYRQVGLSYQDDIDLYTRKIGAEHLLVL